MNARLKTKYVQVTMSKEEYRYFKWLMTWNSIKLNQTKQVEGIFDKQHIPYVTN